MKLSYSALVCSSLLGTSNAAMQMFKKQREEVQATFNIPDPRKSNNEGSSIENLRDSDPVKVIIKTADTGRRGAASMVMTMSSDIATEIASTGIIAATLTKKEIEMLRENPGIKYIEEDSTLYAVDDTAGHIRKLAEDTPYGIPMVLEDMDFWKGLDAPSGSIKVCVADTGYDLGHEDLPKGGDVTGSDSSSNGSWDSDGHGHGTHCSGTVAGLGENSKGVVGVIPDNMNGKFQLVIGKALSDSGSGSNSGVLGAVQSCVDNGAKVISLSLGGGGYSSTTDEFYKDLYENEDILFVAAAGNGGSSSKLYPASYPALMSVAAIDSNQNKASFSQYNDQVEISAPGVSVKSSLPNDKYASWSGTSMATPHVAGVAGLLWMYFPECKNYQIRNVLAATAEDLGDGGCDTKYGHGLVQAKKAYELLSQGNCGGNLGKVFPAKGGCEQSVPDGPTAAPTPQCSSDSECDDGDVCTADTCENGLCQNEPDCGFCGKSKVDVQITIDNYGDETTYDIKDSSGNKVMEGSGWPANSVNSFWQCFDSGSYTFTIKDAYGDGICCSYGNGGYSVKVNDVEVATGGQFGSEEKKTFDVAAPPTPSPISQTPEPSSTVSTIKTFAPTTTGSVAEATFAPTTTGSLAETFAPTTTGSVAETFAPTTTGSTINNPPSTTHPTHTPPTMHPTHTPPTMYPTHTPPTSFPTGTPPTPFPTETPPTSFPTVGSCKLKGEPCTKGSDCCKNKCNIKKQICKR